MKRIIVLFFVLFTLIFSTKLFSQSDKGNLLGVGISLDPARIGHASYYFYNAQFSYSSVTITNSSPIMFYIPINMTKIFRLEPSFGILTSNYSNTLTPTYPGAYTTTTTNSGSIVTVGLRAVYLYSLSSSFGLYFGPRIDLNLVSTSNGNPQIVGVSNSTIVVTYYTDMTETDIIFGGVFGAEYFPISHLSLGGEVSFNYTKFGNPDITNSSTPPQPQPVYSNSNEITQYSFHTDALFFLRWYFL